MTLAFSLTSRRPGYLPQRPSFCEPVPPFRLVLPRDKRNRLCELTGALTHGRECSVRGCSAECLPVVLVDAEREALLCPHHQLVHLDGTPIEGQPLVATAAW